MRHATNHASSVAGRTIELSPRLNGRGNANVTNGRRAFGAILIARRRKQCVFHGSEFRQICQSASAPSRVDTRSADFTLVVTRRRRSTDASFSRPVDAIADLDAAFRCAASTPCRWACLFHHLIDGHGSHRTQSATHLGYRRAYRRRQSTLRLAAGQHGWP